MDVLEISLFYYGKTESKYDTVGKPANWSFDAWLIHREKPGGVLISTAW